jgi:hypothetical protein
MPLPARRCRLRRPGSCRDSGRSRTSGRGNRRRTDRPGHASSGARRQPPRPDRRRWRARLDGVTLPRPKSAQLHRNDARPPTSASSFVTPGWRRPPAGFCKAAIIAGTCAGVKSRASRCEANAERRTVLETLGVHVWVWKADHAPRWEIALTPLPLAPGAIRRDLRRSHLVRAVRRPHVRQSAGPEIHRRQFQAWVRGRAKIPIDDSGELLDGPILTVRRADRDLLVT